MCPHLLTSTFQQRYRTQEILYGVTVVKVPLAKVHFFLMLLAESSCTTGYPTLLCQGKELGNSRLR